MHANDDGCRQKKGHNGKTMETMPFFAHTHRPKWGSWEKDCPSPVAMFTNTPLLRKLYFFGVQTEVYLDCDEKVRHWSNCLHSGPSLLCVVWMCDAHEWSSKHRTTCAKRMGEDSDADGADYACSWRSLPKRQNWRERGRIQMFPRERSKFAIQIFSGTFPRCVVCIGDILHNCCLQLLNLTLIASSIVGRTPPALCCGSAVPVGA